MTDYNKISLTAVRGLYDTLKEDGYSVTSDYAKWRNWFLGHGQADGGYAARKSVYDALHKEGYDVGNSYEDFRNYTIASDAKAPMKYTKVAINKPRQQKTSSPAPAQQRRTQVAPQQQKPKPRPMSESAVRNVYDQLMKTGDARGTYEQFRANFVGDGVDRYHNRLNAYRQLKSAGANVPVTYEEFMRQYMTTPASSSATQKGMSNEEMQMWAADVQGMIDQGKSFVDGLRASVAHPLDVNRVTLGGANRSVFSGVTQVGQHQFRTQSGNVYSNEADADSEQIAAHIAQSDNEAYSKIAELDKRIKALQKHADEEKNKDKELWKPKSQGDALYNVTYGFGSYNSGGQRYKAYMRKIDELKARRAYLLRGTQFGADLSKSIDERLAQVTQALSESYKHGSGDYKPTYADFMNKNIGAVSGGNYGNAYLNAAKNYLTDAQKMMSAVDADSREASDLNGFFRGAKRGLVDGALDVRTWDYGITDYGNITYLRKAADKWDRGENLTYDEQALLDAMATKMSVDAYFASGLGRGYKAGKVTAESIPFMIEMLVNPASATGKSMQAIVARYALKKFGKAGLRNVGKYAARTSSMHLFKTALSKSAPSALRKAAAKQFTARAVTRAGGDVLGSMAMSATTGQVRVLADALNRTTGQARYRVDNQGLVKYDGHDDPEETSLFKAYGKAFFNNTIQNHSEMVSAYIPYVGQLLKSGLGRIAGKEVARLLGRAKAASVRAFNKLPKADMIADLTHNLTHNSYVDIANGIRKRANIGGPIEEYLEEVIGNVETAIVTGDMDFSTEQGKGVFNLSDNIDTFLGVSLMTGAFSVFGAAGYRTPHYRAVKALQRADEAGQRLYEGNEGAWEQLKQHLDECKTQNERNAVLMTALGSRASEAQKQAVLGYVRASQFLEGVNNGTYAKMQEEAENDDELGTRRGCINSYMDGQNMTDPQSRREALLDLNAKRKRALALEPDAEFYDSPELYDQLNPNASDEQRRAVSEYAQAKAKVDGINDAIEGRYQHVTSSIEDQVGRIANTKSGNIIEVELEGRHGKYYVRSGNISVNPEGYVNHSSSDRTVVFVDEYGFPIAGNMDASTIEGKVKITNAQSVIDGVKAKAEAMREAEYNAMDGRLSFAPGSSFNIMDDNGEQHKVSIAQDEQGNVVAQMDGAEGALPLTDDAKATLQSKADIWQQMNYEGLVQEQEEAKAKADAEAEAEEGNSSASPSSEAAPTTELQQDQAVAFTDADGNVHDGRVNGETADGGWEIEFDDAAPEGKGNVDSYTADELKALGIAPIVDAESESTAADVESEAANAEEGSSSDNQTSETQSADEASTPSTSAETSNVESKQRAIDRIPTDGQGQHIYEQAPVEDTAAALIEQMGGDVDEATENAKMMLSQMQGKAKKAAQRLEDIKDGKVEATMDEIIQAKNSAKVIAQNVKYWEDVVKFLEDVKKGQEVVAEEEAKAKLDDVRDEREAEHGVPDWTEDRPQDARDRGFRMENGSRVERQGHVPFAEGKEVEVKFSDKVKQNGHVVVMEADDLQPSHMNGQQNVVHFIPEAQPKDRTDQASVVSSEKMASQMNPAEITSSVTAYTGAPSVNVRGEVIQGNNRSAALKTMWAAHPERADAYKQYLMDHAEEFGLNADDIAKMEHPVLVNMMDVDDAKAIELGQYDVKDTESGGTERIKAKNVSKKMGQDMRSFASILLSSEDEDASLSQLIDRNGAKVLEWMNAKGYITPTQYKSAFDSKGELTAEAKNDLKGILFQNIFQGGTEKIEEMFSRMPAKAQRAILSTAFRDYDSTAADRMLPEIQNSIVAFNELMQDKAFASAKNMKDAQAAIMAWMSQYKFDEATGESYLPTEKYSNFALQLAAMYKVQTQGFIQDVFNQMFDLIQGTKAKDLFNQDTLDNTPRTLAQAIKEVLNIDYNGIYGSDVLAGRDTESQSRRQGSEDNAPADERSQDGEGDADSGRGTGGNLKNSEAPVHQQSAGEGSEQDSDGGRKGNGSGVDTDAAGGMEGADEGSRLRMFEEEMAAQHRGDTHDSERNRRKAESERLVSTAKKHGVFVPIEETYQYGGKVPKRTGESVVYVDRASGTVTKVKDPYAKSAMKSGVQPEDAGLEHLVHNLLFPETAYTLKGITEKSGEARLILSQDFIPSNGRPTKKQIAEALAKRGLMPEDNYSFGNEYVSVTDVEGDNVILGKDGQVYFIDPIIRFKKPLKEILDAYGARNKGNATEKHSESASEEQKQEGAKEYSYQLQVRPYGIGSQPEGCLRHVDDGSRFGSVVYDHPLSEEEVRNFSLVPITEAKALEGKSFEVPFGEETDVYHIDKVDDNGTIHFHVNDEEPRMARYHELLNEMGEEAREVGSEKHSERAEDAAGETEAEAKPKQPVNPDANLRADIREARDLAKMMFPDVNPELLDKIARDLNQQPLTRKQREQMERIAKAFGLRIRWFKTMPQNGTYSKEKGVICIATDSWHQLSDTFGHEMTHALKDVDMDAYNRLKQAVIEASAKNKAEMKGLQMYVDEKYSDYDAKDRMEEYVSDTVGAAIASRDLADKILFNLDHKVLGRMRDIVTKMMAAVSDFSFNTENKVRNLLHMDERVRDERVPSALDNLQGAIMDAYRMAHGKVNLTPEQRAESVENAVERGNGNITDNHGSVTAVTDDNHRVKASDRTYDPWTDNLGRQHIGTRQQFIDYMSVNGYTQAEITDFVDKMDYLRNYIRKVADFRNEDGTFKFKAFHDWNQKQPQYKRIGEKIENVVSTAIKNGEYPVNQELSTDCIKREAFTKLMNTLVARGTNLGNMGPVEINTVKNIMRKYGIQVACDLCFVEGKRLQILNWAQTIVDDWNRALGAVGLNPDELEAFNFGGYARDENGNLIDDAQFVPTEEYGTKMASSQWKAVNEVFNILTSSDSKHYEDLARRNKKNWLKYRRGIVKKWKAVKTHKGMRWSDKYLTAEQKEIKNNMLTYGVEDPKQIYQNSSEYADTYMSMEQEFLAEHPDGFFEPNAKQRAELDKIRNNNIDTIYAKMQRLIAEHPEMRKRMQLSDLLGSKGLMQIRQENGDAHAQLWSIILGRFGTGTPKPIQDAVPYSGEVFEITDGLMSRAYVEGGARMFSFSDFDITKVFDIMQIVWDMAARKAKLQSYSKESSYVILFGKTGTKINISTLPKAVVSEDLQRRYKEARGKDELGRERKKVVQHEGMENAGLIVDEDGRITDLSWSEEHSAKPDFCMKIFLDPERNANCGAITVGASVNHSIFAAAQDWIRMVIPFHLSGMPLAARERTDVNWYFDNTPYQNTRVKVGKSYTSINSKGAKDAGHVDYNFYENEDAPNWDMRTECRKYVQWCEEKGYIPRFDWGINSDHYRAFCEREGYTPNQQIIDIMDNDMTDGVWNGYYKFITDFNAYKPVLDENGQAMHDENGHLIEESAPHRPVTNNISLSDAERLAVFGDKTGDATSFSDESVLQNRTNSIENADRHLQKVAREVEGYLEDVQKHKDGEMSDAEFEAAEFAAEHEGGTEQFFKNNDAELLMDAMDKDRGVKRSERTMELGHTFSNTKEDFDAVRERAIEENGIVMPNLNKEEVRIVPIEAHEFGHGSEGSIAAAMEWASKNLVTTNTDDADLPTMRDGTQYTISKKAIEKYLSRSAVTKSTNMGVHLSVLQKLTDVIHESIEAEIHADYPKNDNATRTNEKGYGENILIHRLYGAAEIDGQLYRIRTTMQEYRGSEMNKPHSYQVTKIELIDAPGTAVSPDSPHLDTTSTNSISAAKLLKGVEKSYDPGKKLLDESKDLPEGETKFSRRTPTSSERALRDGLVERLREAGLGVSLSEEEGQRVLDLVNGVAREMRVYHGTHADFDHFDHSFMNSGEGAQAFGWGSYVTEVEGIGRTYAINITRHRVGSSRVEYVYNGDTDGISERDLNDIIDMAFDEGPSSQEDMISTFKDWLGWWSGRLNGKDKDEYKWNNHIYEVAKKLDPSKFEYREIKPIRHLYTVEIPDDTGSNYLDWDGELTNEQYDAIEKQLEKNGKKLAIHNSHTSFKDVYKELKRDLGSDKAASELLNEAGFTGIKYPADYMRGGRKDGAKNYVVFNDKDLEITDHVRFFRGKGGEAYGFTVDGKIYIDPKHVNAETPIHEYAHLWATALQQKDAKAWGDVVSLMKDTGIWDSVREAYPELKTDDEIADEVLATYSGQRGAERLREEMRQVMQGEGRMVDKVDALSAMERVRNAIARFWRKVAEMLGIRYTKAEDVADHVLGDLLDRVNPNVGVRSDAKAREQFIGEQGAASIDHSEEVSTRMDNLGVAREMEADKKDAKAIKMATGWERGADGKWRYEVPDIKLKPVDEWLNKRKKFTLADIVEDNDPIFEMYPKLKDIKIEKNRKPYEYGASYNNSEKYIKLPFGGLRTLIESGKKEWASNDFHSTLIHEVQHAIQYEEGFAHGGSSEVLSPDMPEVARKEYEEERNLFIHYASEYNHLNELGRSRPDGVKLREEAISHRDNMNAIKRQYMLGKDGYHRLSGEVEARNAQKRMDMTPEERRQSLAFETEDVSREDQIFLGVRNDGDVKESKRMDDSTYGQSISHNVREGVDELQGRLSEMEDAKDVDAVKAAIRKEGDASWKEANRKNVRIAEMLCDERKAELEGNGPAEKFSLRDGSFIRSGSYFSGGGLLEEGLKNYLDPRVAVEFNEKIAGVYADNFGRHIVTADVRNVDPRELTAHVDGSVEYFHASPVCKNFSRAKREAGEVELDKETAQSTADFIRANRPRVVTIENVKGYRGSDALKIITDALTEEGYDWDADVYNTGDFGGYTKRERLIVRAVRDGKLPEKPKPLPQSERKDGWMEAVSDLMDSLPEKRSGVPEWMDKRLKAMGIDWRHIDKPLYVLGQGDAADKVSHAFADELLPTLRTKGGDVIIMPDGRVLRATPRVLARVTGLADDYKMPVTDDMAHTIVGNGIPSQLSEHVVGPLLEHVFNGGKPITHDMKESRRVSGRLANTGNTSSVAQRIYEEAVRGRAFEWDEAWHDSLVSVKALQDALAKERGVAIRDLENVYLHLVHLSSVSATEMTEYRNKQVENLLDAMNAILKDKTLTIEDEDGKKHRLTEEDVETYLNCKHGLERNEHIARKKAKAEADEKYADDLKKLNAAWAKAAKDWNDHPSQQTKDAMDNALKDLQTKEQERDDYENSQYDKHRKNDDYSGLTSIFDDPKHPTMTNEELEDQARDFVAFMEQKIGQERVDDLWDAIHDATLFSLRKSYKSGLISKETYDEVKDMYKWYVPLRGFAEDTANDVYEYMEHAEPKTQQELKNAKGRTSRSDGILANIMNMGSSAILHGNQNLAKQKLLNLAMNSKSSLLSLNTAFYKPSNKVDANGKSYDELVQIPDYILNEDDADVRRQLMEQWTQQMEADPNVKTKFDKLNLDYRTLYGVQNEHAVSVFRGGKQYMVYVNGNPRAAQSINGTNIVRNNDFLLKSMSKVTRWMSQMMTSYNPSFVTSNAQRDFTSALLISEAKYGAGYTARFANNVRTVFPFLFSQANWGKKSEFFGMYQLYMKYKDGTLDMDKPIEKYFSEFMANGGETGYTQSMSVDEYKDFIEKELKDRRRNKVVRFGKKPFGAFMRFVEELNRGIENSCRFAAYMTSRETGRSVLQSVQDAKEVSTNFNLHGSGALGNAFFRDAYAFTNPAVQSVVQYWQLTKQNPKAMLTMAASTIALGVMNTWMLASMVGPLGGGDGDDDKGKDEGDPTSDFWNINPYTRRNYLLIPIPIGKGNWMKIAMAPEIRALYGVGVLAAEYLLGRTEASDCAVGMLDQLNQLMPHQFIEPTETFKKDDGMDYTIGKQFVGSMMPTSWEPIYRAWWIDRDFMGKQITNQSDWNQMQPEWQRASYNTSEWLVNTSKWLNNASGGDEYGEKGYLNFNPSRWGYLTYSYLGGIGQLYDQGRGLFKGVVQKDEKFDERLRYVPVINRMFTTTNNEYNKYQDSNARFQYYESVHNLQDYKFRNGKRMIKDGTKGRYEVFGDLWTDPDYNRSLLMDAGKWLNQIDKLKQLRKATNDEQQQREYSHQINEVRKNAVRAIMYVEEHGGLDKVNEITAGYRDVKNDDQVNALNEKRSAVIQQVLGEAMKKYPNPFPFKDSEAQKDGDKKDDK